jgi:DNA-binding MarR family transcriptional regulator
MADEERDVLIEQILKRELALCRLMGPMQSETWLDVDMSMAQLKTFFTLASAPGEADGLRVSDMARRLGVTPPTASTLIDRLVERGLVDRREDPSDRRQHRCRLTPAGQELLARLYESGRWRSRSLLAALNEEELRLVRRTLEILIRAAEQVSASVTPRPASVN